MVASAGRLDEGSAVAIWADDIALVREMTAKHQFPAGPIVDIGGLERPCLADYTLTILAAEKMRGKTYSSNEDWQRDMHAAQTCRYLDVERPLSFLGDYTCENPETGGPDIGHLHEKYPNTIALGTCLSVLEHVDQPWFVEEDLHKAFARNGLLVISVPWTFPWHGNPVDHFRFSPTGLRKLFGDAELWEVLEADWRLDIAADAGVLDIKNGRPQAIQSCYLVARRL